MVSCAYVLDMHKHSATSTKHRDITCIQSGTGQFEQASKVWDRYIARSGKTNKDSGPEPITHADILRSTLQQGCRQCVQARLQGLDLRFCGAAGAQTDHLEQLFWASATTMAFWTVPNWLNAARRHCKTRRVDMRCMHKATCMDCSHEMHAERHCKMRHIHIRSMHQRGVHT